VTVVSMRGQIGIDVRHRFPPSVVSLKCLARLLRREAP